MKKIAPFFKYPFLILVTLFLIINGASSKGIPREPDDAKAFKILKAKMIDPKTGLPNTLDPNLIPGEDRQGYQIAEKLLKFSLSCPVFAAARPLGMKISWTVS